MTTPPTPPTDNLAAEGGPRSEMSEQEALADLLAEHELHASMNVCLCRGWRATPDAGSLKAQHRAHLADALADLLAARDRRVRGEALREAAEALYEGEGLDIEAYADERYGDWLRDRADRIEAA